MAVQPQPDASPSPWSAVARAVALLTLAVSVLLTAFAWPSVRSSVHDVPIAVAGPAPAVRQISAALDHTQARPDQGRALRFGQGRTARDLPATSRT